MDNTDIDSSRLYTQPEEVAEAYEVLERDFAQLHHRGGVWQRAWRVQAGQRGVASKHSGRLPKAHRGQFNTAPQPAEFVFHGGSGSSLEEIREAIGYGTVKMNIDTDMQWAFLSGVRDYVQEVRILGEPNRKSRR